MNDYKRPRPTIRCKPIGPIRTPMPKRAHPGDAGLDLCAATSHTIVLGAGEYDLVQTGWAVEIPAGFVGLVFPRSGLARDGVLAACGVIDYGYTGPVGVNLYNHGTEPIEIDPLSRIAQLVLVPCLFADPIEVAELGESERGANGFGSTGR